MFRYVIRWTMHWIHFRLYRSLWCFYIYIWLYMVFPPALGFPDSNHHCLIQGWFQLKGRGHAVMALSYTFNLHSYASSRCRQEQKREHNEICPWLQSCSQQERARTGEFFLPGMAHQASCLTWGWDPQKPSGTQPLALGGLYSCADHHLAGKDETAYAQNIWRCNPTISHMEMERYQKKTYSKFKITFFEWSPPWHSIWHMFWHSIWHLFWHSLWQSLWHSIKHSIWHSMWHLALAIEILKSPLRSGARSWGPAVPTEIWSSKLRA